MIYPQIATCSYKEFRPVMGVPVQTSVGVPKFVKYPMGALSAAAPFGLFKIGDREEFRTKYLRRLDSKMREIEAGISDLGRCYPGECLVMLCFEDLTKGWCHRTLFAEWWTRLTGDEVLELGKHPTVFRDPGPVDEQTTLL